jgi:hypothetical protein
LQHTIIGTDSMTPEGRLVAKFQQDPTFALYCRSRLHRAKLESQMGWLLIHDVTELGHRLKITGTPYRHKDTADEHMTRTVSSCPKKDRPGFSKMFDFWDDLVTVREFAEWMLSCT